MQQDFAALGVETQELDLRRYFADPTGVREALSDCSMVWASGGNAFTLRAAMKQSRFDTALLTLLGEDAIAYGGYSAGAVVAAPTLRGIDLVDSTDPSEALPTGYGPELVWDGLALVPYSIAPHYRSAHSESERIEAMVKYFQDQRLPYRTLRDGEAIVIDGPDEVTLSS